MKLLKQVITIAIAISIIIATFFAIKNRNKNAIYLPNASMIERGSENGR